MPDFLKESHYVNSDIDKSFSISAWHGLLTNATKALSGGLYDVLSRSAIGSNVLEAQRTKDSSTKNQLPKWLIEAINSELHKNESNIEIKVEPAILLQKLAQRYGVLLP